MVHNSGAGHFGLEGVTGRIMAGINCNMDEVHAAIGRVQLKKLPGIIEARQRFVKAVADGSRQLQTVKLVQALPGCEGAYWFLMFKLDLKGIGVDKEKFVEALKAEGLISVFDSYLNTPALDDWCRKRKVFGSSGYPWASPLYKGDPDKSYELPNALAADECHFHLYFHEGCGAQEVADTVSALKKVEQAYVVSSN